MTESWDWALTFETNNLLHTFTQTIVLAIYFTIVYWKAGLVNFGLILLTMLFIRGMFTRQMAIQEGFALAQKKKEEVTALDRVGSRIRSAEIATLVASAAFVISLAVLLVFSFFDPTFPPADAVLLFLGFRMQNSNLAQTSSSLMRFARAKALSEAPNKYRHFKWDEEDEEEIG
jgi:hypothetical protein